MAKMTDEYRAKIEEALAAINDMRKHGLLSEDDFHKSLVSLAYEYAVSEEPLRAATMLQMVPLSYYQGAQIQQMREDPNYLYAAYRTAQILVESGLVDLMPVKTNVPQGQA